MSRFDNPKSTGQYFTNRNYTKCALLLGLILCFLEMPIWYYQFFRVFGTIGFCYLGYIDFKDKLKLTPQIFIASAIVLNPIIEISFGKNAWQIVDIVLGLTVLASIFHYYKSTSITTLAKGGDPEAQLELGSSYNAGRNGFSIDPRLALFWYQKAAEQGLAEAQFQLARCYSPFGIGKDKNKEEYWYQKAAEQGHSEAQVSLGMHYGFAYHDSPGSDNDKLSEAADFRKENLEYLKKSLYWYHKAAEQGNKNAYFSLGLMYNCDYKIIKDIKKAIYWMEKAAEPDYALAQYYVGYYYSQESNLKDLKKAIYWYERAAEHENINNEEHGVQDAQTELGEIYSTGPKEFRNYAKAEYWFAKAAKVGSETAEFYLKLLQDEGDKEQDEIEEYWRSNIDQLQTVAENGNALAQFSLAMCYFNDFYWVNREDTDEAVFWLGKSAEQGYPKAQYRLGCYYAKDQLEDDYYDYEDYLSDDEDQEIEKDFESAVPCWERAAQQGYVKAQTRLGKYYYDSLDSIPHYSYDDKEYVKAFRKSMYWYKKAAKQGDAEAQLNLGNCYDNSEGPSYNRNKAAFWYTKASQQGNEEADIELFQLRQNYGDALTLEEDYEDEEFPVDDCGDEERYTGPFYERNDLPF